MCSTRAGCVWRPISQSVYTRGANGVLCSAWRRATSGPHLRPRVKECPMEGAAAQADFCFVHFTDTHIMASGTLRDLDTSASLQRVIEVINALEPRPAFAVIGGDLVSPDMLDRNRTLTQAEYEPSYHLFLELIRPLQCPTYMLLGNHDHRQAFHQVMH